MNTNATTLKYHNPKGAYAMLTKIAIQTSVGGDDKFVTESQAYNRQGAYRYTRTLEDAVLFSDVSTAARWLESASFYNGKEGRSFSGGPRFVLIEETSPIPVPVVSRWRVVGPA